MATKTIEPGRPVVPARSHGEALWFNNDLLTVKASAGGADGSHLLVEELARQGKTTPLHAHGESEESFYILEGEILFHLDGGERTLAADDFVCVPRGVPHAYLVTSQIARSLILITPDGTAMEAFFREAGEPAAERALPRERPLDLARIGAAAERTGAVTILGPPPFGAPAA